MEWFNQLLSEQYLFALGWVLIHALWQIAGVGLLLWALLKIQHKKTASYKYRLSVVALLLIPILGFITFSYELQHQQDSIVPIELTETEQNQLMLLILSGEETLYATDWKSSLQPYIPQLVNFWFIGSILFLIRLAAGLSDINQLRRKTNTHLSLEFQDFLIRKSKQLNIKTPINLLQSIHVDMPVTFGIWKPVILIPTSLLLQISPAQLEAIISHELAHIKRLDYLFNMIQRYLEVIYFFHPAFWWVNAEIRKYREMACDELALDHGTEPKTLAYGLANVLNHAKNNSPELALAAAKKDHPTLMRIKKIMGIQSDYSQPTILTSITMILTLLIGATLLVSAEREPQSMDLEQEKTEMETQDLGLIPSDTTKNEKNIVTDEGVIIRIDDRGNLAIIDTTKTKSSKKLHLDSLFADKYQLSPEEWERIQKSFKKQGDWHIPFKDLDFDYEAFSNMPMLKLHEMPMPDFGEMPKFDFDPEAFEKMLPGPEFYENLPRIIIPRDSANIYRMPVLPFHMDTTNMDKEKMEQFKKELKENTAAFRIAIQAQNEERKARIQEWKSEHHEELAEWQEKQKEWTEKNGAKIREWSEQNQPLIEEYKIKIQKWQEENEPQLEEYKKEMEEWRKNYEAEMMELKKQLKEMQLKMKDQKENQ